MHTGSSETGPLFRPEWMQETFFVFSNQALQVAHDQS